ncbi:MAG: hypothetical protein HYT40_01320 [Candidatus Sungbacteria bacterium]|uniref:Uncharacterized protein n=1 Tax=Candidatus Sungiibacteriota bacterium TaxID=2750080 RepID=A0A931SCE7_9BACT|nr:hypothetical protein [Candidatus Sungbacteria bacterium]
MDSSEDQNPIKQNSPTLPLGVGKNLQLPFFFSKIEVIAVIGLSLVAVAVKIFPQYFSFVSDLFAFFWLVVALIISVLLFYEGIMRFANTALSHYANNILWIIILGGMAAVTGGVKSPFLFLLFFPIVISTFDLLPRAPVILGALAGGLVLLMGVFVHGLSAAGSAYLLMALEAGAIYIFGYFVSLTVRETLHERYEKEELKAHYAEFTEIDRIKDSLTRIVMTEFHHPLEDILILKVSVD